MNKIAVAGDSMETMMNTHRACLDGFYNKGMDTAREIKEQKEEE